MITTPEPRLEPSNLLYEVYDDTDFIQPLTDEDIEAYEEMCELTISDEHICEIYRRLGL